MAMTLGTKPRIALVGATGAVGRVMLDILHERAFPMSELVPLASARSEGRRLKFGDDEIVVRTMDEKNLEGFDLVLFDTPDEIAKQWAPVAVRQGAIVVDNSAAWRMDPDVPLVVPEINPQAVHQHKGIIASPNCTTIDVIVPLFALHREFGLTKMIVSSYQAVSGAGQVGIDELGEQAPKLANEMQALMTGDIEGLSSPPSAFPATIAFNVIPLVGSIAEGGFTGEEWKLLYESRKIMDLPELDATGTCVRVPTLVGHGASVYARFERPVDLARATDVLMNAEGVEVTDVPNPLDAAGRDACFVGRIRKDPSDELALWFFSVSDNLRKGAALNTVQVAELLLSR